jgi:hypothetical protein
MIIFLNEYAFITGMFLPLPDVRPDDSGWYRYAVFMI